MTRSKLASAMLLGFALTTHAGWDKCKFLFGQTWDGPNAAYSSESDFVTIWIGNGGGANNYNTYWEGDMLRRCKSGGTLAGKTPVLYSYIIAELAKVRGGLKDCDVAGQNSSVSLCTQGAKFIRANRALIVQKYQEFAQGVAKDWGTTQPIVWLLEPDFYQYTEASSYWGTMQTPLTQAEAGSLMAEMVGKIRTAQPNALLSLDISPWMGGTAWQSSQTAWLNAMPKTAFAFRHTSGGRTQGNNDRIRADGGNLATWGGISQLSGMGVIADDGYGVGGASNGEWTEWMNAANLNARIANGVVALSVPKPGDWTNQIKSLRTQLAKPTTCGTPPMTTYTLSLGTTTNGTLAANPTPPTGGYLAGTTVTVMASPKSGYQLAGWTGACAGTGACSVVMNGNLSVGATFTTLSATKYTLAVATTTNGTLTANPTPPTGGYLAGTTVTVAASPNSGYQLAGWTGACAGTGACSIVMNGNLSVGATFSALTSPTNLLVNGAFTSNATGWNLGVYGGAASGQVTASEYLTNISKAGTQAWHVQFTQGGLKLVQGKTYTLSFRARADAARTVNANVGQSASPYSSYLGAISVALTPTMQTFAKTFTMSAPTDANVRVEFNSGLAAVRWVLDDVRLIEATTATPAVVPGATPGYAARSTGMDALAVLAGKRLAVSGQNILFDASGLGRSTLELRSLDGTKHLELWTGESSQILSLSTGRLNSGLWVATLRGPFGSDHSVIHLLH